jgi:hypothetical protein
MSSLFHALFMVLWSHIMLISVDAIQYGTNGVAWLHIILLIWSSAVAGFQFYILINDIIEKE